MPIRMQARADFQPLLSAGRLPQFSPVRILIFLLSSEVCDFRWSIFVNSVRTPHRTGADAPAWLFVGPGRDARGFSNLFVVSLYFGCSAKPLCDFPGGLEFVEFGRTGPDLCVRLGVIDDDLLLQSIMVQSAVTLGKVHLFAARIPREIGPHVVVETNRFDNERVSLPPANRVPQPTGVWIFGKWPPVGPDGAPNVELLEEHEHPARNLNDLHGVGKDQKLWRTARLAMQGCAIFRASDGPGSHQGLGGIELRLPPRRQRRANSIVDAIHARESWFSAVRVLHPNSRQIMGKRRGCRRGHSGRFGCSRSRTLLGKHIRQDSQCCYENAE